MKATYWIVRIYAGNGALLATKHFDLRREAREIGRIMLRGIAGADSMIITRSDTDARLMRREVSK